MQYNDFITKSYNLTAELVEAVKRMNIENSVLQAMTPTWRWRKWNKQHKKTLAAIAKVKELNGKIDELNDSYID